ncbi:MAG: lysozyme inhibitor LprI family protein [Emticicia sp.]
MLKKIILVVFCSAISFMSFSQTQFEINEEAQRNFKKSDKELNRVYTQILSVYKNDKVVVANLKKAQRLWVQFRDAEMNAKFPEREVGYYGSIFPMCWDLYLRELTEERIKKLNVWLIGLQEGDACSGAVRMKE